MGKLTISMAIFNNARDSTVLKMVVDWSSSIFCLGGSAVKGDGAQLVLIYLYMYIYICMGFYLNGILALHFISLVREKPQKTIVLANKHRGFNCKWSPSESIAVWTFLLKGQKQARCLEQWWLPAGAHNRHGIHGPFISIESIDNWWIPGSWFKSFWTSSWFSIVNLKLFNLQLIYSWPFVVNHSSCKF